MSASRDQIIEALQAHVVPVLRERGFKGSFPHFRRRTEKAIHLLTFQFDRSGGGFVVELAVCPPDGLVTSWGEQVGPSKVTAHHINSRRRLGATKQGADHWFRYDRRSFLSFSDPYRKTARDVLPLLDSQAEAYWNEAEAPG